MAIFDYVMLLVSVVLSLGLARLLETHARLVKRGSTVTWSAVYMAWLLVLGAMHVDLWATLWVIRKQTNWPWTMVLGYFFQAIALFYSTVLVTPDEGAPTTDLWQFHLENRRRYLTTLIISTLLGSLLAMTFVSPGRFLFAVCTVTLPLCGFCLLAMIADSAGAQRVAALGMIVTLALYFATYLTGFSGVGVARAGVGGDGTVDRAAALNVVWQDHATRAPPPVAEARVERLGPP